jgi:hypothetical protein
MAGPENVSSEQVVDGVASFCLATLPELTKAYDYVPSMKEAALPDVVVEVLESYSSQDDPAFPFWQLEQRHLFVWRVGCSFMVDNANPLIASEQLRDFEQRLLAEALRDSTLGGRVPLRSPRIQFGYTPPLVEYEDGTVGREMTMQLGIADLLEVVE